MQVLRDDDLVAEARACGDMDVGVVDVALRGRGFACHLLVAFEAGLVLRLAGLRRAAHPFELGAHLLRALLGLLALRGEARGLRLEVGRVVALVGVERSAVDFADPFRDVVQEVAVVRDGEDGALVVLQELLEPQHRFGVQMVGGFVEQQQVGRFEQQLAERDAAAFPAREDVDGRFGVGALKRIHGLRDLAVQIPAVHRVDFILEPAHLGHERVEVGIGLAHEHADLVEARDLGERLAEGGLDVLVDVLRLVERRFLLEDAHAVARGEARVSVGDLFHARHDLEQRGLAHAVRTYDADLGAGVERHRDVVQDDLVAVRLARLVHLVDEFRHEVFAFLSGVRCGMDGSIGRAARRGSERRCRAGPGRYARRARERGFRHR